MKVRILTAALLVAAILLQPEIGTAQNRKTIKRPHTKADRWYVLVGPDGDFSLSFPQKPTREADEPGENSVFISYGLYTPDGMRFSINFSQLPADPNLPSVNQWTDEVERSLLAEDRENKRHVVSTRRIGKNTFEAEIWDASGPTGEGRNYIRQTIFRRGRVYTLLCGFVIPGRRADKSVCRRFLDSMTFLDDSTKDSR